jgi:hypothetical protein
MPLALAVLSAAAALSGLPQLPERGLALETKAGVQLQTLTGRGLADLPGLNLATDQKVAHRLVFRDRRGRILVLDRAARRLRTRPFERGCRHTEDVADPPRAYEQLEVGVCGAQARRGIYAVPVGGKPRLMLRTARFVRYATWGGS